MRKVKVYGFSQTMDPMSLLATISTSLLQRYAKLSATPRSLFKTSIVKKFRCFQGGSVPMYGSRAVSNQERVMMACVR